MALHTYTRFDLQIGDHLLRTNLPNPPDGLVPGRMYEVCELLPNTVYARQIRMPDGSALPLLGIYTDLPRGWVMTPYFLKIIGDVQAPYATLAMLQAQGFSWDEAMRLVTLSHVGR